ncbi:hypothetical protein C922_01747 [Plasmodium inui San Antonio 1]|uniref:Uncharacterized protein n=1 Tax=Plasmodium inui San Antonio 1 TaxID=1237626 RepID=W7A2X4_9APIC|nr:hypothetical protein C922_01747 [Plasmodium inui San Antonio 1]EUD67562.1 hypothetical protein C922_01747 [Plasmodium inui San Antonio 1]
MNVLSVNDHFHAFLSLFNYYHESNTSNEKDYMFPKNHSKYKFSTEETNAIVFIVHSTLHTAMNLWNEIIIQTKIILEIGGYLKYDHGFNLRRFP